MLFYLDEAGDFAVPKTDEHKIAVCVGISVPETRRHPLENAFSTWRASLNTDELDSGEPKGRLLRPEARALFFDCLDGVGDLLVHPTFIDLNAQRQFVVPDSGEKNKNEGLTRAALIEDPALRQFLDETARRLGNLSETQVLVLRAFAHCLEYTLRHAILFQSHGPLRDCWNQIRIMIDQRGTSASREELVFRAGLPFVLVNRSRQDPIMTMDGTLGSDHPLWVNFSLGDGFDVKKMLSDLSFVDSKNEIGIQIADILANSFLLAVSDLDNSKGNLRWYARVMKHSPMGPKMQEIGPIVIAAGESRVTPAPKYDILERIVASIKQ